jgi:multiple RNA-binding domain-containing protein 1
VTSDHKGKGLAYIKFKHAPHALEAFEKLDGTVFQGRLLHVLPAVDRQTRSDADNKHGVKEKKLNAKKQSAARKNNLWDWGALYMNVSSLRLVKKV